MSHEDREHRIVQPKVLVADDDANVRFVIRRALESAGLDVTEAVDGAEAQEKLSNEIIIALFDLKMPRATGIECLQYARKHYPSTQVVILSAMGKIPDVVGAMKEGAFWYLEKPFDADELLALVQKAQQNYELIQDNKKLRSVIRLPDSALHLVGSSPAMREIFEKTEKIATLDATILITGESGAGKTALAHYIHQTGSRHSKPFISISCASIPRELLEAELFGYERGAFTGATNSRPGCIELASEGTLFLDEIGDMPQELQPKLLTFLQERKIRRVGGRTQKSIDVRVIAATNQNLPELCKEGKFREDLYFRINVIPLQILPLRERVADLEELATSILNRIAQQRGATSFSLSSNALESLQQHSWPGNIRELENVLEHATAFIEGPEITADNLFIPNKTLKYEANSEATISLSGLTLQELERAAIVFALKTHNGNKAQAAQSLGISTKSIYNKITKYSIKDSETN